MAKSFPPRPRQRHLPNTDPEPVVHNDIEQASDNYVEVRDSRMNMTNRERELKKLLRDTMSKHKLQKYKYGNKLIEFVHAVEADVKVRTIKPKKEKKPKKGAENEEA